MSIDSTETHTDMRVAAHTAKRERKLSALREQIQARNFLVKFRRAFPKMAKLWYL